MYAPHPNGGGLVEDTAHVDATAYVGPNAKVYGNARVCGNAQVYGDARVYGDAHVSGKAHVLGNALVYGNACVRGYAHVEDCVRLGPVSITPTSLKITDELVLQITDGHLSIGCQTHVFAYWLEHASRIAEEHESTHLLKYRDLIEGLITEHLKLVVRATKEQE